VGILTIILAIAMLVGVASEFGSASEAGRVGLTLLGLVALGAGIFSAIQIWANRGFSQVVIFTEPGHFVIATSSLHEGYKLRFFRDVLNENITSFTDSEREHWSVLEQVAFHPVFKVHSVRKQVLLPLCFMVFDEVFVVDHSRRWDFFNSRNTSEPTYSDRGVGPFEVERILPQSQSGPSSS